MIMTEEELNLSFCSTPEDGQCTLSEQYSSTELGGVGAEHRKEMVHYPFALR